MAPRKDSPFIKDAKVLVVGAGGIGCELLKTLALTGFQYIDIIDMDFVEHGDLNRQIYFQESYVGYSKAGVARRSVLKFQPHISITSHQTDVKGPRYDVNLFKQFNIVLIAIDNLDVRRHVNRLCLAANVPLIESGTAGFLGQVTVHVKGLTECYECQPKPAPKTYPVSTITSTPSEFVHCIVWAKEVLLPKLFGDKSQVNDLNVHSGDGASSSEQAEDVLYHRKDEDIEQYGRRIYDHIFGHNIEVALSQEETWKNRDKPKPIYSTDVLPNDVSLPNRHVGNNGATSDLLSLSKIELLGLRKPEKVLSLMENSRDFLEATKRFLMRRKKGIGFMTFEIDDPLAVVFVTAAANIRAASFGIPLCSLGEAKDIAGNVVHAPATINAIIAGLIVIETLKVLQNDWTNYRMTYCLEHPTKKMLLMPVEPFEPNKSCYVCSEAPLSLEINTKRAKLRDIVDKVVWNKLGMNSPLVVHGETVLYEIGDGLDAAMISKYEANLDKVLSEFPCPVTSGTMLTIEDLQQRLSCNINIKHREEFDEKKEPDGMVLSGWTQATSVVKVDNKSNANAGSASSASELEADKNNQIETAHVKKRKLSEVSGWTQATSVVKVDKKSNGNAGSASELEADKNNQIETAHVKKRKLSVVSEADMCSVAGDITKGNVQDQGSMDKNHESGFKFEEPKAAGVASSTPVVIGQEKCRICIDGHHHTVDCPFLKFVPPGSCVGAGYSVICKECGYEYLQPTAQCCWSCGEWGGRAVEESAVDEVCRNDQYIYDPVE